MERIELNKKSGFQAITFPFVINDVRGVEFYSDKFSDTRPLYFNLPKGIYFLETGKIKMLNSPLRFKKIHLPVFDRVLPNENFKIRFGNNPNKCTVFHGRGIILFDEIFRNAPKYILYDIFFHELGHRFYNKTHENFADLYATKRMLELGFNKSQIGRANLLSLRSNQEQRKKQKIESLK